MFNMRNILFSIGILSFFISSSWACRVDGTEFRYEKSRRDATVYVVQHGQDKPQILLRLPNVKFSQLRAVGVVDATLRVETTDNGGIWGGTELFDVYTYRYFTDGRHILWAGKVLHNPDGKPAVDIASFRAYGRFASDKYSLYFDGVRTDDNVGDKQVDMATLQEAGGDLIRRSRSDDETLLQDRRSLYSRGRYLGSSEGFAVVGQKSWDRRGGLFSRNTCEIAAGTSYDTIIRTIDQIIVNGMPIEADPDSFQVMRWIPQGTLVYRDKKGAKHYAIGDSTQERAGYFTLLEDSVVWEKGNGQTETLDNVNPERFFPISSNLAQYEGRLYQIENLHNNAPRLKTIILDDSTLTISGRFNAGKHHGYLIPKDGSVQVINSEGPLVVMDKPDERGTNYYAHDDRYVYIFDSQDELHRYKTDRPEAVYLKDGYGSQILVTVEGEYYGLWWKFVPKKD